MACVTEPVLNIIVVGFHHKKGCQVEFCYPPLVPGNPTELPSEWRYLPALALPDGSHNYLADTIFFHLPGLTQPANTVYAVSCFRQIPLDQVIQKTEDMTRSSVQKSVCVICRAPLFGRLAVKMELVVEAWFRQGDFSQIKILEEAYRHFNSCPVQIDQTLEGLNVCAASERWRHKLVVLFKLVLLRRRVVLHGAPAGPLSAALLALVSLLPQCLQQGLAKSANIMLTRPTSPQSPANEITVEDIVDGSIELNPTEYLNGNNNLEEIVQSETESFLLEGKDKSSRQSFDETILSEDSDEKTDMEAREKCHSVGEKYKIQKSVPESQSNLSMARDLSVDGLYNLVGQLNHTECGFPLDLFTDGYLCLPYLSLQYLDLLSDPAVQGFLVGASNVLFKQKRQLFDVLVETNELRIETADLMLRRQLTLGTEDLRFADHVLRHGASQGDGWIRDQFTTYLVYLLKTSLLPEGSREIEPYNALFMSAFKATPAYSKWLEATRHGEVEALDNIMPLHPFAGAQLSVADVKLKLAHTMSNTEGGRKVSAAVASTGRAVATTSRAVGGAISQARGALSGWWSALTTPPAGPAGEDDRELASDAEDALEHDDNKSIETKGIEPPDREVDSINEISSNTNKIQVV